MTTLHTYDFLLHSGDRLAATTWDGADAATAVAATLRFDAEAIVLAVGDSQGRRIATGHAPGGLAG